MRFINLGLLPKGKKAWIRAGLVVGVPVLGLVVSWFLMIRMPGQSHAGPLPPLTASQSTLRDRLERHVRTLARDIGTRASHETAALGRAMGVIEAEWMSMGYVPRRQEFLAGGTSFANLEVESGGAVPATEIVVVGAHYDTDAGSPGANDNATGVAAVLEISRAFAKERPARIVRFVAFANEEPPWFQREGMGSLAYARRCREKGEKVVAMLSLETLGCYKDEPGTQLYPFPFQYLYPSTGNFVCFVGNTSSRGLVRECVASFRGHAAFPSEGAAPPGWVPGIGLSDHWSFWQCGYPALVVTDTAPFRYEHYHTGGDVPERVDSGRLARVVEGLTAVVRDLANPR